MFVSVRIFAEELGNFQPVMAIFCQKVINDAIFFKPGCGNLNKR